MSDTDELTTKILIGLPFIETEECDVEKQRYQNLLKRSKGFKNITFERCFAADYGNYVEFGLAAPMRLVDPYETSVTGTFEIIRHDDAESGNHHIFIRSNPSALCDLDKLVIDEFWQSLDLNEVSPLIRISNDLRDPQTLILNHVFVNGSPVIESTEYVLERRDSVEVVLSDVTTAWVFDKSCNISSRTAQLGIWAIDSDD